VWDNVVDNNPDHNDTEAVLATSFYALPELKSSPGPLRGSGLVTEWQQSEGRLIAGGNTNIIRCWDVESEKCSNIIDSQVHESCATSFVTAWDYIHNGHASGGFSGLGPDIMFGGYGDGKIKVFDLRLHVKQGAASSMNSSTRRKKSRLQKEHVHKNWIVNIAYTHSPTKYEVGHMYYFNSFAITDLTY
jgi:regulator-associated protein of mTOR